MPNPFLSSEEYDERAHAFYNDGKYDEEGIGDAVIASQANVEWPQSWFDEKDPAKFLQEDPAQFL